MYFPFLNARMGGGNSWCYVVRRGEDLDPNGLHRRRRLEDTQRVRLDGGAEDSVGGHRIETSSGLGQSSNPPVPSAAAAPDANISARAPASSRAGSVTRSSPEGRAEGGVQFGSRPLAKKASSG